MVQNKTFSGHPKYISLNACVGNNGWNGIYQYAEGYFEATKQLLEFALQSNSSGKVDLIVYPIVYNARHGLELTLKSILMTVAATRKTVKIDLSKIYVTHDLNLLWQELQIKLPQIDRRFISSIQTLNEHIQDYANIDPTGQIFRYPNDNTTKTKHLEKTSLINLYIFYIRFTEMSHEIHSLYRLAKTVEAEYDLGTYTSKLSRNDISKIADKLPKRSNWKEDTFLKIKEEIKSYYNLSSNDFTRALNLIQTHPEFSQKIGIELAPKYTTKDAILLFLEFHAKKEPHKLKALEKHENKTIAEIATWYHIGRDCKPCELFKTIFDEQLSELIYADSLIEYLSYYLGKSNLKQKIITGMRIMGHSQMAQKIEAS